MVGSRFPMSSLNLTTIRFAFKQAISLEEDIDELAERVCGTFMHNSLSISLICSKSWPSSEKYGVMKPHPPCGKFSRKHLPTTCLSRETKVPTSRSPMITLRSARSIKKIAMAMAATGTSRIRRLTPARSQASIIDIHRYHQPAHIRAAT